MAIDDERNDSEKFSHEEEVVNLQNKVKLLEEEVRQKTGQITSLSEELDWIKENAPYIPPIPKLKFPKKGELMTWLEYKEKYWDEGKDFPDFLEDVWQEYLDADLLYQDNFGKVDEEGLSRLNNYVAKKDVTEKSSDLVPPKSDRIRKPIIRMSNDEVKKIQKLCSYIRTYRK